MTGFPALTLNSSPAACVKLRTMTIKPLALLTFAGSLTALSLLAAPLETKPTDPFFEKYQPVKATTPRALVLKPGDRLAICGDSITEQKMYSRIMETYLTVCAPELAITVRQYGWGGETAPGFLRRMTNDCLRFKPTIATTCYGMNDHGYRRNIILCNLSVCRMPAFNSSIFPLSQDETSCIMTVAFLSMKR